MNTKSSEDAKRQHDLVARVIAGTAFTIKTPPAEVLFAALVDWLTAGHLGGLIVGPPRLGKTHGTRWVLSKLLVAFGSRVPWAEIPVRDENLSSAGGFFQHILRCMRAPEHRKGTVADRRDRLTERLLTWARRSPIRTVILFFDEAQQLSQQHYRWLLNITNELDPLGYRVFCLLVGQRTLVTKTKAAFMEMPEMDQVVGRFMVGEHEYEALGGSVDVKMCLEEMDIAVPRGAGRPFAANFLPQAHASGLKLETAAPLFWSSLEGAWREAARPDPVRIPMQYFCSSVVHYLQNMAMKDDPGFQHDKDAVERAVKQSGYANAIRSYSPGTYPFRE